jgi:protein SCO1/2
MLQTLNRSALFLMLGLLIAGFSAHPQALAATKRADRFPNLKMTNQDNKEVRFYEDLVKDKIVIINFMYTECTGICERGTKNLVQVQKALGDRLGREVFIYSITLDPKHDTPAVLKAYAKSHGANWTFLTGKEEDITVLQKKLGLANTDPELRRKLALPTPSTDEAATRKQHSGMIVIGYEAFNKWSKASVLSRPDQILQIIERMKPPTKR